MEYILQELYQVVIKIVLSPSPSTTHSNGARNAGFLFSKLELPTNSVECHFRCLLLLASEDGNTSPIDAVRKVPIRLYSIRLGGTSTRQRLNHFSTHALPPSEKKGSGLGGLYKLGIFVC
jgi:hypothetical protein